MKNFGLLLLITLVFIFYNKTIWGTVAYGPETFNGSTTSLPTGWTATYWTVTTVSASSGYSNPNASGSSNVTVPSGTVPASAYLVSPIINFSSYTHGILKFGNRNTATFGQTITVQVSADNGVTWTAFSQTLTLPGTTWGLQTLDLGTAIDNKSQVYIRWVASAGATGTSQTYKIDDVQLEGTSPVADPNSFSAATVSPTQINLTATANGNGNPIVVVSNTSGTFSVPTNGVAPGSVGSSMAGGTVVYVGAAGSLTNNTGLTQNTQYYYKAFSYDASNNYSGGSITNATTYSDFPSTQASNISFSSIHAYSMTVSWTNGNGDKRLVIINTSNSFTPPADFSNPVSNSVYSGSGEQVIYFSSGAYVAVSGLSMGTTYYFEVFEANTNSGNYIKYNTSTGSNNPLGQITLSSNPFWEDCELGSKSGYAAGDVTMSMGSWNLNDALIGSLANDRKNGNKSIRIENSGIVTMNFDKSDGAGNVGIYHALYGTDAACTWKLQQSTDAGSTWTDVGSPVNTNSTTLTLASFTVNIAAPIRFKIVKTDGTSAHLNIDDISIADAPTPVELSSFNCKMNGRNVQLAWETKTEKNSYLFEIERTLLNGNKWECIGSVKAGFSSNIPKQYSFIEKNLQTGKFQYRLKMIDKDGSFEYSKIIEAEISQPKSFELGQNYPNPFNPSTKINYSLPADSRVILEIYNITGEKISQLVNEEQSTGYYTIDFNSSSLNKSLTSGIYLYRITAIDKISGRDFTSVKKMILLK